MAQAGLQLVGTQGFLGVNLRRDRLSLADQEVAYAINADLHTYPGVAVLRFGKTTVYDSALATAVRYLARHNNTRYQVAGTVLYRNATSILTGLSDNRVTTLAAFKPLNDDTTWAFIADDALMRKDSGSVVRNWGIAAPTAAMTAAAGAAGSLTGDYGFVYTYARVVSGRVAHESNPSPAATVTLASQVADLSVIADSADAQVTHKRIYRTIAGGTVYLFDQQIAQGVTTATSSQSDNGLGAAVEEDNDVPETAAWVVEFQGHLFTCREAAEPDTLRWTKRNRPESQPTVNFIKIGSPTDPLQCAVPLAGMLGVFTRHTKYRVVGTSSTGFTAQEALSSRGTPAFRAVIPTEYGAIFPARDGVFLTNFISPDQELSGAISPLFDGEPVNGYAPINWNVTDQMSMAVFKKRLYFAYADTASTIANMLAVYSHDTKHWYFYDHAVRSLFYEEEVDALLGGGHDGFVYILEDLYATDSRSLTLETKDFGGPMARVRKLWLYVKVDIEGLSADVTGTVKIYIDGTLRRTATLTQDRFRRTIPLPQSCLGYQCRVRLEVTATSRVKMRAVEAFYLPLEAAA